MHFYQTAVAPIILKVPKSVAVITLQTIHPSVVLVTVRFETSSSKPTFVASVYIDVEL